MLKLLLVHILELHTMCNYVYLVFQDKTPAMTWYTTFVLMYPTLNKTDIDKEISAVIFSTPDVELNTVYFKLCIVLGVLKLKITETNCE